MYIKFYNIRPVSNVELMSNQILYINLTYETIKFEIFNCEVNRSIKINHFDQGATRFQTVAFIMSVPNVRHMTQV